MGMILLKKETDLERIKRLKEAILHDYIEDEETNEMHISQSDLKFLVLNAEKNILSKHNIQKTSSIEEIPVISSENANAQPF